MNKVESTDFVLAFVLVNRTDFAKPLWDRYFLNYKTPMFGFGGGIMFMQILTIWKRKEAMYQAKRE